MYGINKCDASTADVPAISISGSGKPKRKFSADMHNAYKLQKRRQNKQIGETEEGAKGGVH